MSNTKVELAEGHLKTCLAARAAQAVRAGRRPFAMLSTSWAPPCVKFHQARQHPLMREALEGVDLIVIDGDEYGDAIIAAGFDGSSIPAFEALDAHGRPAGRGITGRAWGPDTPEDMAAALGSFFRSGPAPGPAPAGAPTMADARAAETPGAAGRGRALEERIAATRAAQRADLPRGALTYEQWLDRVKTSPFSDRHGAALVLLTLIALLGMIAAPLVFAPRLLQGLPVDRGLAAVLALPYLAAGWVVFLALSRAFHALHVRRARALDARRGERRPTDHTGAQLAFGAAMVVAGLFVALAI